MPTQITDVSLDPYGITYTADEQTWKVLEGVAVFGTTEGAHSEYASSTLNNKGSIYGNGAGVVFDAKDGVGDGVVKNKATGKIEGGEAAISVYEFTGSMVVDNEGKAKGGFAGILAEDGSADVQINNDGKITGIYYGIGIGASVQGASGPVIDNSGKIEAGFVGILINALQDDAKLFTTIHNHESGLIKGVGAAIIAQSKLELTNEGKIKGVVFSADHDDNIVNTGKIKGEVWLGAGVDTFKNKGDAAKSGMIDTAEGNDLVMLGQKADKLLFSTELDASTNVDTVKNFVSGADRIYLNSEIFSEIAIGPLSPDQFHQGTAANDADDRIVYDKAAGKLYYDADGSESGEQVQFADLGAGTKLKASDFLVGDYHVGVLFIN